MGGKISGWGALRLLLVAAVLAVFVGGILMLTDFFESEGGQPADIDIPPPPPPPAAFDKEQKP